MPAGRERLAALHPDAVQISAQTGEGLDELLERVADFFARGLREVRLLVPYADGAVIDRLRGVVSDLRIEHTAHGVEVQARLPEAEARRYAAYVVERRGDARCLTPTTIVRRRT